MKLGKLLKKIFNPKPIDNYVSEIDQFLASFEAMQAGKINASVEAEKAKHRRIAYLRDNAVPEDVEQLIWEEF